MADCWIYDAVRTPRGKGKAGGSLYTVPPIDLACTTLNELYPVHALALKYDKILRRGAELDEHSVCAFTLEQFARCSDPRALLIACSQRTDEVEILAGKA